MSDIDETLDTLDGWFPIWHHLQVHQECQYPETSYVCSLPSDTISKSIRNVSVLVEFRMDWRTGKLLMSDLVFLCCFYVCWLTKVFLYYWLICMSVCEFNNQQRHYSCSVNKNMDTKLMSVEGRFTCCTCCTCCSLYVYVQYVHYSIFQGFIERRWTLFSWLIEG